MQHKLIDTMLNSLVHRLECYCGKYKLYSDAPLKIQNKIRLTREMQEHVEKTKG